MGGPWFDGSSVSPSSCHDFWRATDDSAFQLNSMCQNFVADQTCTDANWVGAFEDLFSPSGTCNTPAREINAGLTMPVYSCEGVESYSASTGGMPTITVSSPGSCVGTISFDFNYPSTSRYYSLAQNGAFTFTVTLGMTDGMKVVQWNGLYNGAGGAWLGGDDAPASSCNNFWMATTPWFELPQMCKASGFQPSTSCTAEQWVSSYEDLSTPVSSCPSSERSINLNASDALLVNLDGSCTGQPGYLAGVADVSLLKRSTSDACTGTVSFANVYLPTSPYYASRGLLEFTLTLGTYAGQQVIKWNGLGNGAGGNWLGVQVPASSCDNFWILE